MFSKSVFVLLLLAVMARICAGIKIEGSCDTTLGSVSPSAGQLSLVNCNITACYGNQSGRDSCVPTVEKDFQCSSTVSAMTGANTSYRYSDLVSLCWGACYLTECSRPLNFLHQGDEAFFCSLSRPLPQCNTPCNASQPVQNVDRCLTTHGISEICKSFLPGKYWPLMFIGWFLVLVFVPLIIFFNCNLASGPNHSFVFFYQCLPLAVPIGKFLSFLVLQFQFYDGWIVSPCYYQYSRPLFGRYYILEYLKHAITSVLLFLAILWVKCTCCPLQKCRLPWAKVRRAVRNFREKKLKVKGVVRGLCSVIVLAYGDLVAITFLILSEGIPTCCRQLGKSCVEQCQRPPLASAYFSVSVICLILLLPLPLSLIYYPSIPALFHKLTGRSLPRFPKLDPVFDVFQGVYKDKMKWFAGIYFVHRLMLWALYAGLSTYPQMQAFTTLFYFVLILGTHSIAQPFKDTMHNYWESLMLLYLVLVSVSTQLLFPLLFSSQFDPTSPNFKFSIFFSVVIYILSLLPIVIFPVYYLYKWCCKNRCVCCCGQVPSEVVNRSEGDSKEVDQPHAVTESVWT